MTLLSYVVAASEDTSFVVFNEDDETLFTGEQKDIEKNYDLSLQVLSYYVENSTMYISVKTKYRSYSNAK